MDDNSLDQAQDPSHLNGHVVNHLGGELPEQPEVPDEGPTTDEPSEELVRDEPAAVDPFALLDDRYMDVLGQAERHANELQRETVRAREQAVELRTEFAEAQRAVDQGRAELAPRLDEVTEARRQLDLEVERFEAEADQRRREIQAELDGDQATLAEVRSTKERLEGRVAELEANEGELLTRLLDTRTRLSDYLPAVEEVSRAHQVLDRLLRSALVGLDASEAPAEDPAPASGDDETVSDEARSDEATSDAAATEDAAPAEPASRRPLGRIHHTN